MHNTDPSVRVAATLWTLSAYCTEDSVRSRSTVTPKDEVRWFSMIIGDVSSACLYHTSRGKRKYFVRKRKEKVLDQGLDSLGIIVEIKHPVGSRSGILTPRLIRVSGFQVQSIKNTSTESMLKKHPVPSLFRSSQNNNLSFHWGKASQLRNCRHFYFVFLSGGFTFSAIWVE